MIQFVKFYVNFVSSLIIIEQGFFFMPQTIQNASIIVGQLILAFCATSHRFQIEPLLIPLIIAFFIFKIVFLIIVTVLSSRTQSAIQYFQKAPPILLVITKVIAIESQLNGPLLLQPYLYTLFHANSIPLITIFSSLIVSYNYLKLFITDQQVLMQKGFEKIQTSLFDFFILTLKIVQVATYFYFRIINTLSLFFMTILQLSFIFIRMPYPQFTETLILTSGVNLVVFFAQFVPQDMEYTLILLISPFLGNTLLILWRKIAKNQKYQLSQLANQEKEADLHELLIELKGQFYQISIMHQIGLTTQAFTAARQFCDRKDLSALQRLKGNILLQDIKFKLQDRFENDPSSEVNLFLLSEHKNKQLKDKIQRLIQEKISFYQHYKQMNSRQLFIRAKKLTRNLYDMELSLKQMYEKYPSAKLKSVNTFFHTEILSNFIQSHKLANLSTISDEKLMSTYLFSEKISYIITTFEQDDLQIESLSSNAKQMFFDQESKQPKNIDQLLPNAIVNLHREFVHNFMEKAKSKFFRQKSKTFLKSSDFIVPYEFFFDNVNSEQLTFVGFFQKVENESFSYLMVDNQAKIRDVSKNFFPEIPDLAKILQFLPIEYLIPSFHEIKFNQKHFDKEIRMIRQEICQEISLEQNLNRKLQKSQQLWKKEDSVETYLSNFIIHSKNPGENQYYIIQLEEVTKLKEQQNEISISKDQKQNSTRIIDNLNSARREQEFEISYLDQSEERNIQLPNEILILRQNSEQEDIPHKKDVQIIKHNSVFYDLFSPNQSVSRLVPQNLLQQQVFFAKESKEFIQPASEELKEVAKLELQEENLQSSEYSQLGGLRQSRNYKKYELIQKIVTAKYHPQEVTTLRYIFTLMLLLTLICILIKPISKILNDHSKDYARFLVEIDMLQIKSLFMGPCDEFLAIRYALFNYNGMYSRGELKDNEFQSLIKLPKHLIPEEFDYLKSNFNKMLKNPSLTDFFKGKTITSFLMKSSPNELEAYNISFQASLNILLNYQYDLKNAYIYSRQVSGTQHFTYSYANYFIIEEALSQMNDELQLYTITRADSVEGKWFATILPFLMICIILNMMSWFFYRQYLARLERQLNLFNFMCYIDSEKERLKVLANQLEKILFRYKFDLQQKEQSLSNEKSTAKSSNKVIKRQIYLPKVLSVIGFVLLLSVWLIVIFVMSYLTISYLDKYRPTTILYRKLSDLNFQIPGTVARREICYNFQMYPFYTEKDRLKLLSLIDQGLDQIQEFISLLYNFNRQILLINILSKRQNYLASEEFFSMLNHVKENDVCEKLGDDLKNMTEYLCDTIFGGSLRRGLLSNFQAMISSLKNEMKVNNFTSRVSPITQDLEGSMISVYFVKQLTFILKEGMTAITDSTIQLFEFLSIFYICYGVVLILLLHFVVKTILEEEYYLSKRFIMLLPTSNLLGNDQLERQIRELGRLDKVL